MAAGDAVAVWSSVAAGSYLDIQPAGAVEWALLSVEGEAEFELYKTDGSNSKLVRARGLADTGTVIDGLTLTATNGVYWRLKNVNAATKYLGYSARVTK